MTTVLEAALAFHDAGCSVIQAAADGSKAPAGPWKQYQAKRVSADQLQAWFGSGYPGIGLVTGAVSGGLEMLEFEARAVKAGLLGEARDLAAAAGLADVWRRLACGYMESTPSGGVHFLYRLTQTAVPGNTKLARDGKLVIAETRGEGGFVIVAPSAGPVHPTGRPWQLAAGSPASIPALTASERQALHEVIRALDTHQPAAPQPFTQPASPPRDPGASVPPGEDFNDRTDWAGLLQPRGWVLVHRRGDVGYWRRPDKPAGISATTGRPPHDNLYVFSTSTEFDAEVPYSKFGAYALLEHAGDHSAAARRLRADGYGTPAPTPESARQQINNTQAATQPAIEPRPGSAFAPADLRKFIRHGVPPPDLLPGELLYRGGIHLISGAPDCGKTTLILWQALTLLRAGHTVVMLDEESGSEMIAEKLIALGAEEADVERFCYIEFPARSWKPDDVAALRALMTSLQPSMVLLDSCAAFMARAGLDENSAADVTVWWSNVLIPLARDYRAAVAVIDHDAKAGSESRFSRGSGAKLAASDVMIKVDLMRPFSRTMNGALKLAITKDRRGWLHRFFDVAVKTSDGLQLSVAPADSKTADGPDIRPSAQKILDALTTTPMTQKRLVDRIAAEHGHGLRRETASTDLNTLLRLGLADRLDQGTGRSALWSLAEGEIDAGDE